MYKQFNKTIFYSTKITLSNTIRWLLEQYSYTLHYSSPAEDHRTPKLITTEIITVLGDKHRSKKKK